MRLVFCGTAEFAVPALLACANRHEVAAVVTRADRPGNRGRPAPRPVAETARDLGIPVLTPLRIRDPDAVAALLAFGPDCLVVAAYGQILSTTLIEAPRNGAVNVHASLLPRWRGASPIARAILAGDRRTGVSIMRMDGGLDTGPVYASVPVGIGPYVTAPELTRILADLGAATLIGVLDGLAQEHLEAHPQAKEGVTLAPRLRREDGRVDWAAHSGVEVDRMVRALQPWPGVIAPLAGVDVQIRGGAAVDHPAGEAPGTIVGHQGESVLIAAREGAYRADQITPIGRRTMTPEAFLRGLRPAGERPAP